MCLILFVVMHKVVSLLLCYCYIALISVITYFGLKAPFRNDSGLRCILYDSTIHVNCFHVTVAAFEGKVPGKLPERVSLSQCQHNF